MHSPTRTSPIRTSPNRTRKHGDMPAFMRRPPKPDGIQNYMSTPIRQLSRQELEDRYNHNVRVLSETNASSSAFVRRLQEEQIAIRARLDVLGVEGIRTQLEHTSIQEDDAMNVDTAQPPPPPPPPQFEVRPIGAKQRALAKYNPPVPHGNASASMSYEEATRIMQASHALEVEQRERMLEKRRRRGDIIPGEHLTRAEKDARMMAFLTYKPSESDLEDDSDDSDDEEIEEGKPAWWDEGDDQDDGRKGQDIVEPDEEDLSNIIRIDEARIPWSLPREE